MQFVPMLATSNAPATSSSGPRESPRGGPLGSPRGSPRLMDHPAASPRLQPLTGPAPKPHPYPENARILIRGQDAKVATLVGKNDLSTSDAVNQILGLIGPTVMNPLELLAVISRNLHAMDRLDDYAKCMVDALAKIRHKANSIPGSRDLKSALDDSKEYSFAAELISNQVAHLMFLAEGTPATAKAKRRQHIDEARKLIQEAERFGMFKSAARMYVCRAQCSVLEYQIGSKVSERPLRQAEADFKQAAEMCTAEQKRLDAETPYIRKEVHSLAYVGLGTLYYMQRKYKSALDAFESAIFTVHQYGVHTLWFLALCHMAMGDDNKAQLAVREVLNADPQHPEATAAMLKWLPKNALNYTAKSPEYLKNIYTLSAANNSCMQTFVDTALGAANAVGDANVRNEQYELLERMLLKTLENATHEQDTVETHYLLGEMEQQRRHYSQALEHYLQALDIRGDHQRALAGIYYCYREQGKPFYARSYLLKLKDQLPHDVNIMKALVYTQTECKAWHEALNACTGMLSYAQERQRNAERKSGETPRGDGQRHELNMAQLEGEVKALRAAVYSQMRDEHDRRSSLEQYQKILEEHYPVPSEPKEGKKEEKKDLLEERRKERVSQCEKRINKLKEDIEKVRTEQKAAATNTNAKPRSFESRIERIQRKIQMEETERGKPYTYWDYIFDDNPEGSAEALERSEFKIWNDVATLHFHFNHFEWARASILRAQERSRNSGGACTREDEAVLCYNSGVVLERLSQLEDAKHMFAECLKRKPSYKDAEAALARLQLARPAETASAAKTLARLSEETKDEGAWLLSAHGAMSSGETLASIELLEEKLHLLENENWIQALGPEYRDLGSDPDSVAKRKKQRGDLYVKLGSLYAEQAEWTHMWTQTSSETERDHKQEETVAHVANAEIAYRRALEDYGNEWPESTAAAKNGLGILIASDVTGLANIPRKMRLKDAVVEFMQASKVRDLNPQAQMTIKLNLAHTMMRKDPSSASARFALKKYLHALKSPAFQKNISLHNACALAYARDGDTESAIATLKNAFHMHKTSTDLVTCYNLGVFLDGKQKALFAKMGEEVSLDDFTAAMSVKEESLVFYNRALKQWKLFTGKDDKEKGKERVIRADEFIKMGLQYTTKRDRKKMLIIAKERSTILRKELRDIKTDLVKRDENEKLNISKREHALEEERKHLDMLAKKKEEERRKKEEAMRQKQIDSDALAAEQQSWAIGELQVTRGEDEGEDKKKDDKNLSALVDDTEMEPQRLGFGRGRPAGPLSEEEKAKRAEKKRLKDLERKAKEHSGKGVQRERRRSASPTKSVTRGEGGGDKKRKKIRDETEEQKAERRAKKAERRKLRDEIPDDLFDVSGAVAAVADEFEQFHLDLDVTGGAGNVDDAVTGAMDAGELDEFMADQGLDKVADGLLEADAGAERREKKKKDKKDKKKEKKQKRDREGGDEDMEDGEKKKKKKRRGEDGDEADAGADDADIFGGM
ncbi:unnamed protein product [Amoebophrya sp. A25]|nr:unnamed protein product [Amoebophrya sp. A25]|eukprot:GSA25T00015015001.1